MLHRKIHECTEQTSNRSKTQRRRWIFFDHRRGQVGEDMATTFFPLCYSGIGEKLEMAERDSKQT